MELTIAQHSDQAGHNTLVLAGSIDLSTRQSLLDAGLPALTHGTSLTLDMAAVEFIDSTGIGALLELARVAKAHEAHVEISRRSARVSRVLEVTGLDDLWSADASATSAEGR